MKHFISRFYLFFMRHWTISAAFCDLNGLSSKIFKEEAGARLISKAGSSFLKSGIAEKLDAIQNAQTYRRTRIASVHSSSRNSSTDERIVRSEGAEKNSIMQPGGSAGKKRRLATDDHQQRILLSTSIGDDRRTGKMSSKSTQELLKKSSNSKESILLDWGPLSTKERDDIKLRSKMVANQKALLHRVMNHVARIQRSCSVSGCTEKSVTSRYCALCRKFVHQKCSFAVRAKVELPPDVTVDQASTCSGKCFREFSNMGKEDDKELDIEISSTLRVH